MDDDLPEVLAVATVTYRERDGGPGELRLDLVDARRRVTVASLTPDEALLVGAELVAQAVAAQRSPAPR